VSMVHAGQTELFYETDGEGDHVVLLSGLTGVSRSWRKLLPRFVEEFQTTVFDQPGSGQSGPPPEFSIEHHALAIAEALRTLELGPAHIVGSSTGGAIGQVLAIDHPDVVRSVTMASSWARGDGFFEHQFRVRRQVLMSLGKEAYADASALFLYSPEYLRDNTETIARRRQLLDSGPPPEVLAQRIDMVMAHDQLDRLGSIEKPCLVIVGSRDACTPPYFSEEIASRIPGCEHVVLQAGHSLHTEASDEFFNHVRDFITRH
jgi:aminoacrylate hydrolase